jgi:hypothetical protein
MKILYLPCHSVLEYDQYKLWTEMGHEVFSFDSYSNPLSPRDNKRPAIKEGKYNERMIYLNDVSTKDNMDEEMIAWADVIIIDHIGRYIVSNWEKLKNKRVVWRTIGQCVTKNEEELQPYRQKGLKVVRYSPFEGNIPGFIGGDAIIRFYKDEEEFKGWLSTEQIAITFSQNMISRGEHCRFSTFDEATFGLKCKVYGPMNQQTGGMNGGVLTYDEMKERLRTAKVYFYTGSQPASYTLNFIEAFMTGIPIVAIGPKLGNSIFKIPLYEIQTIIENGVTGYCLDDIKELKFYTKELFNNSALAVDISRKARIKAIELFGKEKVKKEWFDFFKTL